MTAPEDASAPARRFRVVLRRGNGRFVKESRPLSRYAAKLQRLAWDAKYDDSYYTQIKGDVAVTADSPAVLGAEGERLAREEHWS